MDEIEEIIKNIEAELKFLESRGVYHSDLSSMVKDLKQALSKNKDSRIEAVEDQIKVQKQAGSWDYDRYMHGMLNGLICALSTTKDEEPQYYKAPEKFINENKDSEILDWIDGIWGELICRGNQGVMFEVFSDKKTVSHADNIRDLITKAMNEG